jgi:hypothetical protein
LLLLLLLLLLIEQNVQFLQRKNSLLLCKVHCA